MIFQQTRRRSRVSRIVNPDTYASAKRDGIAIWRPCGGKYPSVTQPCHLLEVSGIMQGNAHRRGGQRTQQQHEQDRHTNEQDDDLWCWKSFS